MTQLQLSGNPTTSTRVFEFTGSKVRAVLVGDDPWFSAVDVCRLLDLIDHRTSLRALDDDEVGRHSMPGSDILEDFVSESGLYSLILRSRKPEAKDFKRWVTREVLPSIRRTGQYSQANLSPAHRILALAQAAVDHEERIAELAKHADEVDRQMRITNARLDSVEHNTGLFTILAHARANRITIDNRTAVRLGKAATHLYRQRHGVEPPSARDERHGSVNLYPQDLLVDVFAAEL